MWNAELRTGRSLFPFRIPNSTFRISEEDMSLDTLANIKTRLGISGSGDDTLLTKLQESAEACIRNWCERDFDGGTFTEYFAGGSSFLHLRNWPVSSVTSVNVDPAREFGSDTVIDDDRYVVHAEHGVIQAIDGPFVPLIQRGLAGSEIESWTRGPRMVQVVYAVSTGAVPDDVKEALARLVGCWYRRVKTDSGRNFLNVMQQKFGDTFVIYGRDDDSAMPDSVRSLLSTHRGPRL